MSGTKTREKADVVIVGLGWSGSLIAEELTRAGLNVVALERGKWRDTATDFPPAIDMDELRWATRRGMMQPQAVETVTFRNNSEQEALPVREWNCFQFGWNVGGAGTHWAGMTWRFNPWDFEVGSKVRQRYGQAETTPGLQLQDWGITYDELEPYYDRFEKIAGTSGTAGHLNGSIKPHGNPFEGSRSSEYPTPALKDTRWMGMFRETTTAMGYHPFTIPAGNISSEWTNPLGVRMGPCTYCGYCEMFGCGNWSKSSPQACVLPALTGRDNFTILAEAEVLHATLAEDGKTAKGVVFIDANGQRWEQPADIVIFTAYQIDNIRLLLLSKIGKPYDHKTGTGVVGRGYAYQTISGANLFFDDERFNPFIGAGALGVQIDDYNADNFDHAGLGFVGGAGIMAFSTNGRPIGMADSVPQGTPRWGAKWKQAYAKSYQTSATIFNQGTSFAHRDVFADLDPTYTDRHGQPLLRVTFDYNENDRRMAKYTMDKAVEIGKKAGASRIEPFNSAEGANTPYDQRSTHTTGGAVIGADPATSALNRYGQTWDVHNVFVVGASSFPNNGGYNPTATVGALALYCARGIIEKYLDTRGPLVEA
ncbi:GMC family oxidoreductase [Novosphingobium sp. 1949]|uniref:GMC family oxidoreductase n=1 Tax=Novosphingobium organovorum TaxID=2930092 RepID=A0ABT0B8M0_9SPHN|nr:GMC family oxidoreductase [Novosphingobium organovorum]MCJ2181269.1 GMC family oxidoreductase [Novosphingobium organovorum]